MKKSVKKLVLDKETVWNLQRLAGGQGPFIRDTGKSACILCEDEVNPESGPCNS